MEHIQHLDELVYTQTGRELLIKFLTSIRERDPMKNIFMEVSRKYDGSPAIVFGKDDNGLFLSTKAFYNATPIRCYSKEDLYEYYGNKVELWFTLSKVWDALQGLVIYKGDIFQADVMFVGPEEYNSEEDYVFKPNLIEYNIFAKAYKSVGLCVHTRIFPKTRESTKDPQEYTSIPFDFVQNRGGNGAFLVDSEFMTHNTSELHGVAVSDGIMESVEVFEHLEFELPQEVIDTCRMLDNALIRGEYIVSDKLRYQDVYTQFVASRYAKDVNEYKSEKGVVACRERFNKLMTFSTHLNVLDELYAWRRKLRKFKIDLIEHFDEQMYTNVGAEETEGLVLTLEDVVVKIVNRESFSKRNFNKNGNSFQK